jgi:hypothetical protein
MTTLYASIPSERLRAARAVPDRERHEYVERLARGSGYNPWPYGMPTSINPLVVFIGVSPGNSPATQPQADLERGTYGSPTFGEPHRGMSYPDSNSYWLKVRELAVELVGIFDSSLPAEDRLALAGHLNLGTGSFGRAGPNAVEKSVVRWVSRVLYEDLRPKIVVGFGLVGVLLSPQARELRQAWDDGGLHISWTRPELISRAVGKNVYTFRVWGATREDGEEVEFVIFPNHPSRAPFAGRGGAGSRWQEACAALAALIRQRLLGDLPPSSGVTAIKASRTANR